MSIEDKRRYASAAFVTLLILSVFWPSPIVSSNRLWFGQDLTIDELSFLGREAPAWDVVFWCIAGLLAIAIVQSGELGEFQRPAWEGLNRLPVWSVLVSVAAIALTWFLLDQPALAFAERIQTDTTRSIVRILNRLGGGMNPPMIVIFFALAGAAYKRPDWVRHGVAMAIAALSAGAVAHLLKFVIGRTRPELWLGPFHYARGSANSFPSGHTVGAFAIAGVLLFSAKSRTLRFVAILLASAVGVSRILAFRHWTSDVVGSALLGLAAAWIFGRPVIPSVSEGPVRVGGASSAPPTHTGPSLRSG